MIGLLLASLWTTFANPPPLAKPWTYYFWPNSLTDRETIADEVADMARLGFGGMVLTDSRGYWDDDDHVRNPPSTIRWGSEEWLDLIECTIREASRHWMSLVLNVAASGGHLRGDAEVGDDAPKFLKCRCYRPGEPFECPGFPNVREVAVFAVRTAELAVRTHWTDAGDGQMSMSSNVGRREGGSACVTRPALEIRELASPAEGAGLGEDWTILRFIRATAPGHEKDVDILDSAAVIRHLERVVTPLLRRLPAGMVGKDKAFAGLYNVSWEGLIPTWSRTLEKDFAAETGYALRPKLPILAGFIPSEAEGEKLVNDFRRVRGRMMARHLYATVREWAHRRGLLATSESGGPWGVGERRDPRTFGACDQFEFLSANDIPQGEFWPLYENATHPDAGRANANAHIFARGVVEAARRAKLPIAAAEAFTHTWRHWTVDPAYLKPLADVAFVDGINRLVWHTYTTSPKKFGVPGMEYFAGSHINHHVTWSRDAPEFIRYLWRCQALLQAGEWVDDGQFLPPPDGSYYPYGRFRKDEMSQFQTAHRRVGSSDVFFVTGEGSGVVNLPAVANGRKVEIWDPVAVTRQATEYSQKDSHTEVTLDLPRGGSAFVVFAHLENSAPSRPKAVASDTLQEPWQVEFRYPDGVAARPPNPMQMDTLADWTRIEALCHFSGTATYRTSCDWNRDQGRRVVLSLGKVPTGLARVLVNGVDCGVVWCAPWEIEVTEAIRRGRNDLRIEYTNNWHNRLVGDCLLLPEDRVTRSVLHYWKQPREQIGGRCRPTFYSGPSSSDRLQSSGLIGPVRIITLK